MKGYTPFKSIVCFAVGSHLYMIIVVNIYGACNTQMCVRARTRCMIAQMKIAFRFLCFS